MTDEKLSQASVLQAHANECRRLEAENAKLRAKFEDACGQITELVLKNEKLREALENYTTCPHVGIACAAECSKYAKAALLRGTRT